MIVVRNVFRLKFGRAKEAVQLWKEGLEVSKRAGFAAKSLRLLTDVTGDFYTLVFEITFDSLTDYERSVREVMSKQEWQSWYSRVPEVTESGHREIYNVVAD